MDILVAVIGALLLAQFIGGRVAFILAFVALVGRRALRRRRRVAAIEKLGLPPEDLQAVSEDLQSGNRDAAIQRIAAVQERHRAALHASGIDVSAMTPEIGPYTSIPLSRSFVFFGRGGGIRTPTSGFGVRTSQHQPVATNSNEHSETPRLARGLGIFLVTSLLLLASPCLSPQS